MKKQEAIKKEEEALKKIEQNIEARAFYCPNCGQTIGDAYCPECKKKLKKV
jgi:predicted RNA-binding Zn-ribbon protein involved in translation (DUF1610 family)